MATTKKVVVEDDEEDATIEEEAEDGIGSRDRSTSSDTNLMRNGAGSSILCWRGADRYGELIAMVVGGRFENAQRGEERDRRGEEHSRTDLK